MKILAITLSIILAGCAAEIPVAPQERVVRPEGVIKKCSAEFNECLVEMAFMECADKISECE